MAITQMEQDALRLLKLLGEHKKGQLGGKDLMEASGLTPERVNDGVSFLEDHGHVEILRTMGTRPYNFYLVSSTPRGRYELQRLEAVESAPEMESTDLGVSREVLASYLSDLARRPPSPVGSPYGFQDGDWELVSQRKAEADRLYVVLGHQFTSPHFSSDDLRTNIEGAFVRAVEQYNSEPGAPTAQLRFQALAAGYGEHLFNEIARDIISADIAVFETSDHNPNVMIEMGVALTWGVRVLPIKEEGRPKPPSDISGQTWADYIESGGSFVDPEHEPKLVRMVERALQKKGRG